MEGSPAQEDAPGPRLVPAAGATVADDDVPGTSESAWHVTPND